MQKRTKFILIWLVIAIAFVVGTFLLVQNEERSNKSPFSPSVKTGLELATEKYNELSTKYEQYAFEQFQKCVREDEIIYHVGFYGGFGSGETFYYSEDGKEIYYQLCGTLPADGCDLLEERGKKPNISEYECKYLTGHQ